MLIKVLESTEGLSFKISVSAFATTPVAESYTIKQIGKLFI